MRRSILLLTLLASAFISASGGAWAITNVSTPSTAMTTPSNPLQHVRKHPGPKRGQSANWSGYDVTGSGSIDVQGSWIQPAPTCKSGENSWSSPWIGIGGVTSNTLEQIGTDTDCSNGKPSYYAWYEIYPNPFVTLKNIQVNPGDKFSAEVSTSGNGSYTLILNKLDSNTNQVLQTTGPIVQSSKKARNSSVEWIMEGPYNGLLTNFGTVTFTDAKAAIKGQTVTPLGSFPNRDPITMVTSGRVKRAVPSRLSSDGSSFSVTWKHN